MSVVAPPAKVRKQSVGDVDRSCAVGPCRASERVEPFKFGDRRGELPDRAQPTQRERLGAGRRTRERIERGPRSGATQGLRVRRKRPRGVGAFGSRSEGR